MHLTRTLPDKGKFTDVEKMQEKHRQLKKQLDNDVKILDTFMSLFGSRYPHIIGF